MRRLGLILMVAFVSTPMLAAEITVPSGKAITFHEMIWNQPATGLAFRFRFISPEIAVNTGDLNFDVVERDMAHLCQEFALPRLSTTGPKPSMIVISIADRETKFGQADPESTQFFEAYSIVDKTCIWEPF